VYPSSYLKVNTIFNVARDAGLTTAYSDKHPAYEIANGPGWNGQTGAGSNGVQEFYSPEVNSRAALVALTGPSAGHTGESNALLAMTQGNVDLSLYRLVDPLSDPDGPNDPHLLTITNNVLLAEKYDDLKVRAILNEIDARNPQGTAAGPIPALFGMNFQA